MARTLIQLTQDIQDQIGELQISQVVGDNDPVARKALASANRVGRELQKMNWAILQKEATITATSGTSQYSLPSDYDRSIDLTAYNATEYWQARGSLSPRDWRFLKNTFVQNSSIVDYYRIRGNASGTSKVFLIDPTPASGTSFVYEYVSKNWVVGAGGTAKTAFAADTDQPLFDDYLFELGYTAFWKRNLGIDYSTDMAEYMRYRNTIYAQDVPKTVIRMGGERFGLFGNIPETGFGA